jgi:hypothetical protein
MVFEKMDIKYKDVLKEIKERTCKTEPLHASWILIYKDVFENIDNRISYYVSSNRNVWEKIEIMRTEDDDFFIFDFVSPVRNFIRFYLKKIYQNDKYMIFRSFSLSDSKDIKSTMDSFVKFSKGIWYPILKFDYMEKLPSIIKKMEHSEMDKVTRFFCQLYDKNKKGRIKTLQYNSKEEDGMAEYRFLKQEHVDEGKILNMRTIYFSLRYKGWIVKFAIKIDSHLIFDTPSIDFFNSLEKIIIEKVNIDFQNYYLKNSCEVKSFKEDGKIVKYIDFNGIVQRHILKVPSSTKDWFSIFREYFMDNNLLYENNRLASFILFDDKNPSIQLQIIDTETSDIINVSAFKDTNEIILTPQCQNSDVLTISKIIGAVQGCLGSKIGAG